MKKLFILLILPLFAVAQMGNLCHKRTINGFVIQVGAVSATQTLNLGTINNAPICVNKNGVLTYYPELTDFSITMSASDYVLFSDANNIDRFRAFANTLTDYPALNNLTYINIAGSNTITYLPSATAFTQVTDFTIKPNTTSFSCDIANCPAAIRRLIINSGIGTINYSSKTWPSIFQQMDINPGAGAGNISTDKAALQALVIDLNNTVSTWAGAKSITLTGNCIAPGTANTTYNAALSSLATKGVTVTTN